MLKTPTYLLTFILMFPLSAAAQPGQIDIPRVEMMPDQPSPYNVRDWKKVAEKYDSLVFDLDISGTYLPFSHLVPFGVNYPQSPTFRMHTYVGTNSPFGNEAINVLPTLVGSSLVGIDKSDQFGQNWVLMAQDFYNKVNGENLYLNNAGASSGNDWWYDMMPNIFFYQLYDLYPGMGGEAELQFTAVADRLLAAVRAMGGQDAPWQPAYMNYRAWNFTTMEPNDAGVRQPEAAGPFAWLLYHAYKNTGNPEYLRGAEWALEFLAEWPDNPSYEIQLPYGTYTAAKMNAELGTTYDVGKMVNWSFDRGDLRGWGTIVGNWGGFDVSGLVGEANNNGNDYAFQMNGMQQAAALAPMVRYDKRFARAIGKWMLNLANASRLFFHGFLPAQLQDASDWSAIHDPNQVIGYEAMRENWGGLSPFSTGDAVNGGWAATNLALYGTSAVGYLGAMVEKTDVEKILKIDLLKTDFFRGEAYPTYLFYNSYATPQSVSFAAGEDPADLYDALTESFLLQEVSGTVSLTIPPGEAILLVVCPAGGEVSFEENKMLIDGVVVDFDQHTQPYTYAPRFKALAAAKNPLTVGDTTTVFATISDADSDQFTYQWSVSAGQLDGTGGEVVLTAPPDMGEVEIQAIVNDPEGNADTTTTVISVVDFINQAPQILSIEKSAPYIAPEGSMELTCVVTDDLTEDLTYQWTATGGLLTGTGSTVQWEGPPTEGVFQITVTVTDEGGLSASSTTSVLVKNFISAGGNLIADYPFSGNADDVSGNELHGQPNGAILTVDQFGHQQSAYYFNGGAQHIAVDNNPILNFQEGITVSCWFKANALPDKETFLLSHGSWQNRWKLSITPTRELRWTVNSLSGISDLDATFQLETDSFYHVTATYDGTLMALYLGGELHSYKPFSGNIRTTSFPLLIGQMLPDEATYNFKGVIDEVRIDDYALTPTAVMDLYTQGATSLEDPLHQVEKDVRLFPNPVSGTLRIELRDPDDKLASVRIFTTAGRLVLEEQIDGSNWRDIDVSNLISGVYLLVVQGGDRLHTRRFVKP